MIKKEIKIQGFTLVELLIVVAIIAILAAIAYPSYIDYKIKTNRAELQTEMMSIAQRLQSHYVVYHNYTDATLGNGTTIIAYPATGTPLYTLTLRLEAQTWELEALPKSTSIQKDDGAVLLNNYGYKCWSKGNSSCTLSVSSSWGN